MNVGDLMLLYIEVFYVEFECKVRVVVGVIVYGVEYIWVDYFGFVKFNLLVILIVVCFDVWFGERKE